MMMFEMVMMMGGAQTFVLGVLHMIPLGVGIVIFVRSLYIIHTNMCGSAVSDGIACSYLLYFNCSLTTTANAVSSSSIITSPPRKSSLFHSTSP